MKKLQAAICSSIGIAIACLPGIARGQSMAAKTAFPLTDTGAKAELFAPGVVSTQYDEWATSFTPDGQTVYFSQGAIYWTIVYSTLRDGRWTKPQVAPFSGRWRDTDPFVTPDGKKLFFISDRPLENAPADKPQRVHHIWYVENRGASWGEPHRLDSLVNLAGTGNYAPCVTGKGTLYFCSRDREGHRGMNSFYSRWAGDHYEKSQWLHIEGMKEIQDPFVAADESYLVFTSGNEIYISWQQTGGWSAPEKFGAEINNGDGNSSPYVSRDGKTLYYSSNRIKGFYKRDPQHHALDYEELTKENESPFNSKGNILKISVNLLRS